MRRLEWRRNIKPGQEDGPENDARQRFSTFGSENAKRLTSERGEVETIDGCSKGPK